MKTFTDAKGREWLVALNLATAAAIKDQANVDLLRLDMGRLAELGELIDDPFRMFDVLWVCLKKQADARSISKEELGESLYGDHLFDAINAIVDELCHFTPHPRNRELFQRVLSVSRKTAEMQQEKMAEFLTKLDASPATDGNSSGDSQESSG